MTNLALVAKAALQWALWVGGNLVGLLWSWTIARGLALVLGFVIVGSILLALALDAWWDGVQQRAGEQTLIANLHYEFETLRVTLEDGLDSHRSRMETARAAAEFEPTARQPSDLRRFIRLFYTRNSTYLRTGTLDGMLSAGRIGLISDDALRSLLASWPSTQDEFLEEEAAIARLLDQSRGRPRGGRADRGPCRPVPPWP